MQRLKYNLAPLNEQEQIRLVEIQFYLMIQRLLEEYNYSAAVYEVIGTLAQLYGADVTMLKFIIQSLNSQNSLLKPDKYEVIIILYRAGYPIRKISSLLGRHLQTIYRTVKRYIAEGEQEYFPRVEPEQFAEIKKFVDATSHIFAILEV